MPEPWGKLQKWTDEEKDRIAGFLREGLSATQISAHFGVSRNAVIGVVDRTPSLKEIGFARGSNKQREKGAMRRVVPIKRRPPVRKTVVETPSIAEELNAMEVATFFAEPHVAAVPLLMLSPRRCKWPVNTPEPRTDGHLFCGEGTNGNTYCAGHMAIAYRPRELKLMAAE